MKKEINYIQQGDVLLILGEQLPEQAQKQSTNVVQEGELTGHAHRLFDGEFEVYQQPETKTKYLKLVTPTALRHEEHKQLNLPGGAVRIGIVKEWNYDEEESRKVLD